MKMLTATRVAALAVGLGLAGAQALAAPPDGRDHRNNDNAAYEDRDSKKQDGRDGRRNKQKGSEAAPQQAPAVAPVAQPTPRNVERQRANSRREQNAERANDRRRGRNDQVEDRRERNRAVRNDDRRNYHPTVRNDDRRRADVRRYHRRFQAPHRFRVGSYRQPYGYSYRRWNYGQHLPRHYYVRNFWLTNLLVYGLFSPPPGYIWVRYGPDALLIDQYTGEIVQVQYDMFYS